MNIIFVAAFLSLAPLCLLLAYRTFAARCKADVSFDPDGSQVPSPERYRPMERLLKEDDFRFLAAQPGFSPKMGRRFRADRRRIFRGYLRRLRTDFGKLCVTVQSLMVHSAEDRGDLAAALVRQRLLFALAMLAIEVRLLLHALGAGAVDVSGLVKSFEMMREQMLLLQSTPQTAMAMG